jgi:rod shape-determining protein MreD
MFKKRIKLILVFLGLFVFQFSFFPYFTFRGATPDLLAVLVVFYSLYVKKPRLLVFALLMGLAKDLYSSSFFGVNMLGYWLGAHALYFMTRKFHQDVLAIRIILVGIYTLVIQIIILLCMVMVDATFEPFGYLMVRALPGMFYTMLCGFFVVPLLKAIMKDSLRQYNLF